MTTLKKTYFLFLIGGLLAVLSSCGTTAPKEVVAQPKPSVTPPPAPKVSRTTCTTLADLPVAIRSETYVNANWKRVFDIMTTDARTASYDPNVNTFKQLRIDHEERIYARHYWFHAVWPTKARDFVMVTTWERLEDGAVLISTIGLPDCVSPRSDECVRAYVCSSSCLIRPGYSPKENGYRAPAVLPPPTSSSGKEEERGDEGKGREKDNSWCHVTFCTHCDPGGGVPSFVTNMLGPSNSLQCLLSMRAIVEKEERDKQGKE